MSKAKEWTGERLETFILNENTFEHLHRYALALDYIKGKRILDAACGEGYGSHILSKTALEVVGIDIDQQTIENAKVKYGKPNLTFLQSSVTQLPFEDNTFDFITSFETIEHLEAHDLMISEFKRVLKPTGILLISSPDKRTYSEKRNYVNPFHVKELYKEEFIDLLSKHFKHHGVYHQKMFTGSIIWNHESALRTEFEGNYDLVNAQNKISDAIYIVVFASDLPIAPPNSSLFNANDLIKHRMLQVKQDIYQSKTYRAGNFLLSPFRVLRNLLK